MTIRFRLTRLIRLRVLVAACLSVGLVTIGLVGVPAAPAHAATVAASGPIASGLSGMCLDDYGDASTPGTIADLYDCNGAASQDWSVMSDGTIQINGLCLDIYGASTAAGTPVDLWTCNGGWNQQWEAENGELVNPTSGLCLDDPNSTTTEGTQQEIWSCNDGANQQWALPAADPSVTYPGGDLVVSVNDNGIAQSTMQQVLTTTMPEAIGAPANASLNTMMQDLYAETEGLPGVVQPPVISGGSISVSGNTVTLDIPAANFEANVNTPGWILAAIASAIGFAAGALAWAFCTASLSATFGAAQPICWTAGTFTWSLVGSVVAHYLVPSSGPAPNWSNILAAAIAAGIGSGLTTWASPWFIGKFAGSLTPIWVAIGNALYNLAKWIGTVAIPAILAFLAGVARGFIDALGSIFADEGMDTPIATGAVPSGVSGKCLDAYGGGTTAGTVVDLYSCNGVAASQSWTTWTGNLLTINGECLDIAGNSTAEGALVELWDCNGLGGQQWEQLGNSIVNPQSGMCLDATNAAQLRIWACNGNTVQQWTLPGSSGGGGGSGGGGSGGGNPNGSVCDIYTYYGTPCVAAYSTTRALYSSYDGPLYQVAIASGSGFGATENIGVLSAGGDVDAAQQDSFCGQYTCVITQIYDQSGHGNNLTIGSAGGGGGSDQGAVANLLPITIGGHEAYGLDITPGVGYRDNSASGTAVNGQAEGMYMVASGTHANSGCCFDFGNAETDSDDNGNGHMDAVNLSTTCYFAPCSGSGPWVAADMENGLFQGGNGSNTANAGNSSSFVTAILNNNGQTTYELEGGNAQGGGLTTWYDGALPDLGGYAPMHQEGGITLGVGGDNSNRAYGSFFEGVMTSGFPTSQADAAVQSNIVAAGYGGNPDGNSTGGTPVGQTINMTSNGAGQCVDVLGDDTGLAGAPVDVWSCQSYAVDQHWTQASNGSLQTLGRCLDLDGDGTAPGTKVEIWNCNGLGGQQFVPQSNGSLYNPQSGLCLDDPSGSTTNGTVLQIWNCLGNAAQNFTFNDATVTSSCGVAPCESNSSMPLADAGGGYASPPAGAGTITLAGGQCLNVGGDDGGHDGTIVDVWGCDSDAIDQQWTLGSNGSLENGMGQCLDIDGDGTAPGTRVELWDCSGIGGQVWEPQSNGSLLNPQSGLCLDDPSGITTDAEQLQIWTCNGESPQVFHVNGSPNGGVGSSPPLVGSPLTMTALDGQKCVDVYGNDDGVDGTVVDIWDCQNYAVDQHWTLNSNDSLETLGRCLDLDGDGTAPGTKVELWDCNGVGGQQWAPQSNGSLYNPQSGLCLDDPSGNTTDGTVLQIWNCLGDSAQVYTFNDTVESSSCSIAPCQSNSSMPLEDAGGGYATPSGTQGTLTLAGGQCVNVGGDDGGHDGTIVDVWGCDHDAVDQQWMWVYSGSSTTASLENGMGQCLDIDGNGTAAGTKVELWDCNGVGGQQWVSQSNGSGGTELYNPQSGLCLDDPSGITSDGEQLQIWTCNGESPQVYNFNENQ